MNANDSRDHLFISYAVEDSALAHWLARKLAAEGYAVWYDRLKLLGGEPWPRDIDFAIKERVFRMIALLSEHSIHKPNPSKERTLGLTISRERGIADFILPLKVDDAALDWLMSDLSYLPFNRGWAEGWRQLLKKLRSINTPKSLAEPASLAASSFETGRELVSDGSERILTNILRIREMPEKLTVYEFADGISAARRKEIDEVWPFYEIDERYGVAFWNPPAPFSEDARATKEGCCWRDIRTLRNIKTHDLVRHLVEATMRTRLTRAGCLIHPNPRHRRVFYLNESAREGGKLWFVGRLAKRTWLKIQGRVKVWHANREPEHVIYMFAFHLGRWRLPGETVALQIKPSLVVADDQGQLITDDRVGPLRKKITRHWFNGKWANRLLAAAELVLSAPAATEDSLILEDALLWLDADRHLDETKLGEGTDEDTPDATTNEAAEVWLDAVEQSEDENEDAESI